MEICNNDYVYQIKRNSGEPIKNYQNRFWHFTSQIPNINNYNKCHKNSEIWSNIKFLKCNYEKNIIFGNK